MGMTDPISDYLTRIRNANNVFKNFVDIPSSNLKESLSKILKEEGFIKGYDILNKDELYKKLIRIYLKYDKKNKAISGLKRISKSSLRVYVGTKNIPKVLGGFGIAVLSTSRGIISDKTARKESIGGEILFHIW